MRNVFYIHGEPHVAGVVPELRSRGIDVSVVTTRGAGAQEAWRKVLSPDALQLFSTEAYFGVLPEKLRSLVKPATKRDIETLAPSANLTLQMLDRMNYEGHAVAYLRHLYLEMIGIWRALFTLHQPEAIAINSLPQFGFDHIVYELAKLDGRKILMFRHTYIEDRVLVAHRIDEVPGPSAAEIDAASPVAAGDFDSPSNEQLNQGPMDLTVIRRKLSRFGVLRTLIGRRQLGRVPPEPYFLHEPTPRHAWVRWQYFKGRLLCRQCLDAYDAIAQQPNYDVPYVYFPLHTEPEEGTVPLGGTFSDSLHAVATVAASLPRGWKLYVKEHPNQFNRKFLMSKGGRNPAFYDRLAKIPNVVPIRLETRGIALIAKARAVATISGTSGWEAVQRGKNALIFGHPWYSKAPGVTRIDGVDSCARALARIERGEDHVDVERVARFLRLMRDRYTIPMIYEQAFLPLTKLSLEEHARSCAAAIDDAIGVNERTGSG